MCRVFILVPVDQNKRDQGGHNSILNSDLLFIYLTRGMVCLLMLYLVLHLVV